MVKQHKTGPCLTAGRHAGANQYQQWRAHTHAAAAAASNREGGGRPRQALPTKLGARARPRRRGQRPSSPVITPRPVVTSSSRMMAMASIAMRPFHVSALLVQPHFQTRTGGGSTFCRLRSYVSSSASTSPGAQETRGGCGWGRQRREAAEAGQEGGGCCALLPLCRAGRPSCAHPSCPGPALLTHGHQRVLRAASRGRRPRAAAAANRATVGQCLQHRLCQVANEPGVGVERRDAAPVADAHALCKLPAGSGVGWRKRWWSERCYWQHAHSVVSKCAACCLCSAPLPLIYTRLALRTAPAQQLAASPAYLAASQHSISQRPSPSFCTRASRRRLPVRHSSPPRPAHVYILHLP